MSTLAPKVTCHVWFSGSHHSNLNFHHLSLKNCEPHQCNYFLAWFSSLITQFIENEWREMTSIYLFFCVLRCSSYELNDNLVIK